MNINSISNSSIYSPFNSPIHSPINTPPDDFLENLDNSPINTIIIDNSIKNKSSYDDFGEAISIETFEFNTPPSYNNELLSTSYDRDSNIAMLYDDRISLFSDYEYETKSIKSNKSTQVEINIVQNKIFDRKQYKEELTKKNTFLNNKKYQIEFNKLILNKYTVKSIDKFILRFI